MGHRTGIQAEKGQDMVVEDIAQVSQGTVSLLEDKVPLEDMVPLDIARKAAQMVVRTKTAWEGTGALADNLELDHNRSPGEAVIR